MKNFKWLFLFISFSFLHAQEKRTRNYNDINNRIQELLEKRELDRKVINVNIEGKTFALVQNTENSVHKTIIHFLPENKLDIIDFIDNNANKSNPSQFYNGDFIKSDNFISVRADILEGKKIGLPLTYNFVLQERDGVLYILNLNTNEKWMETVKN